MTEYRQVVEDEAYTKVLIIAATSAPGFAAELAETEAARAARPAVVSSFRDRFGFEQFVDEAGRLIEEIASEARSTSSSATSTP